MQQTEALAALDPADRHLLSAWLAARDGIDAVLDLSPRPWRIPGDRSVIGVFETGRAQASWLIVAERSVWVVAQCADGTVSEPCATLAEILTLIDHRLAS
jgi:hypothetical protein